MTAARLMVAASTVGLIVIVWAAVDVLLEKGPDRHVHSLASVLIGGMLVAFIAFIAVLYVGATL